LDFAHKARMSKELYLIKFDRDEREFNKFDVVELITVTDSGNCYLVADINNPLKREWIMNYDLYPVFDSNFPYWYYKIEEFEVKRKEVQKSITA